MRTGKITSIPVITSFPSLSGAPLRVPSLSPANQRPAPAAGLEATGILIERVPVDTEELIAWRKDRARPIDSSARAEFAARQLRKIHLSE